MKKQENLKEIIKNAPKGLKLYSPAYGEVYFECIENNNDDTLLAPMIVCKSKSGNIKKFFVDGSISIDGECMLFPDNKKTWDNWQKVLIKVGDIVSLKDFNKICKIIDKLGENQIRLRDTKDFICIYDLTGCTFADNKEIEEYNKSVVNDILGLKSDIDPYKLNLGDFISIGNRNNGFQIISIVSCIKGDDLYDTVRLTIWDDGRKELKINPINALDKLNEYRFCYRKATKSEKLELLEEMQKVGWTWNSDKNIIEVYDI